MCTFSMTIAHCWKWERGVSDASYCTTLVFEHAKGYNLSCSTEWISVPEQVVINLWCSNKRRPAITHRLFSVASLQIVKAKGASWLYNLCILSCCRRCDTIRSNTRACWFEKWRESISLDSIHIRSQYESGKSVMTLVGGKKRSSKSTCCIRHAAELNG